MPSCVNSPTGPSEVCLVAAGNLQDCLMGPVEGKYVPPPGSTRLAYEEEKDYRLSLETFHEETG